MQHPSSEQAKQLIRSLAIWMGRPPVRMGGLAVRMGSLAMTMGSLAVYRITNAYIQCSRIANPTERGAGPVPARTPATAFFFACT